MTTQFQAADDSARKRATLIGLTAVAMWSTLGLFTAMSGQVPPLLLNGLCFTIAGLGACAWLAAKGRLKRAFPRAPKVWALGITGLFGYHALYFTGLRNAPAVDANLLNYLWPLLIVVFSGLLPGERLRWYHLAGAGLGFVGAILLVTKGGSLNFESQYAKGYIAALGAALFWSSYSVLSRRFADQPTDTVAGFCLATGILSLALHAITEPTIWPANTTEWFAVLMLGAMPVGSAFFVWDIGMKHGHIQVLGASAYAAPILSTLLLIAFGFGDLTWNVALACLAITAGALLASKDMFKRRP